MIKNKSLVKRTIVVSSITVISIFLFASCSNANKAKTAGSIVSPAAEQNLPGERAERQPAGQNEAQKDTTIKQADTASNQTAQNKSEPAKSAPDQKQPAADQKQAVSEEAKINSIKLYEQGNVLYNNGDYEGAIKILKQAVQADPENFQALNVLGVSQAFLGSYDEADKNLDKAIGLNPNFANATFNKAISMKLQKKYDEAIKYFDITIKLNPNDVWSHYGKATIYSEREDVKSCITSLKIALDRDPGVKAAVMEEHEFDPVRKDPEFQKLMK